MAKLGFNIEWITRPCVFHYGDYEIQNGFWHMWHQPQSGGLAGKLVGIVEDERGAINKVKCDNILFLDSEEKFKEYDWALAKERSKIRHKEYERKYEHG